ncbi:MAG TPA: hypothetical protein VHC18_12835 [Amycolatopsis sp.]|nr:hypothetical protein [Amycolatopsis sp.]
MNTTIEPATGWSALLHTWQTLDLPEGWKAEIADGCLRATPPPGDVHNNIADLVSKALVPGLRDD